MINHDQVADLGQRGVHFCRLRMPVEIVFHHDSGVCFAVYQLRQRLIERTTANHRQTDAVGRRSYEGDADIAARHFQCFRDVGCRFDNRIRTGVRTGDDQWLAGTGQRLHDHVDFLAQAFSQISDRRC